MAFQSKIEWFKATVDPEKATVVSFTNFIAVFGGSFRARASNASPKSWRDSFIQYIRKSREDLKTLLVFPEEYKEWKDFDKYSDLLLFETDLGYLTSVVLIFLEAPGAIAEFSAFSQIPSLRERLLVVVKSSHFEANSFIRLGPIRSVVDTHKQTNALCVISDAKTKDLVQDIDVIISSLEKKRKRQFKAEAFDKSSGQHQLLLVLDLINLFNAIKLSEIQELCSHMGFVPTVTRFKEILFVLDQLGLIGAATYGQVTYHVPGRFSDDYLSYSGATNSLTGVVTPFKKSNFRAKIQVEVGKDTYRRIGAQHASLKVRKARK